VGRNASREHFEIALEGGEAWRVTASARSSTRRALGAVLEHLESARVAWAARSVLRGLA